MIRHVETVSTFDNVLDFSFDELISLLISFQKFVNILEKIRQNAYLFCLAIRQNQPESIFMYYIIQG